MQSCMYVDAIPFLNARFRKFPTASDTLGLPDSGCSCRQWVSRRLEAGQQGDDASANGVGSDRLQLKYMHLVWGAQCSRLDGSWGIWMDLISSCEVLKTSSDGMECPQSASLSDSFQSFQSPSSLCELRIFWSLRCRANTSLQALPLSVLQGHRWDKHNDVVEVFSLKHVRSLPVGGFLPTKKVGTMIGPDPGWLSNASTSGSRVYFSKFDMVVLLEVHDTFGSTLLGCYFSGTLG